MFLLLVGMMAALVGAPPQSGDQQPPDPQPTPADRAAADAEAASAPVSAPQPDSGRTASVWEPPVRRTPAHVMDAALLRPAAAPVRGVVLASAGPGEADTPPAPDTAAAARSTAPAPAEPDSASVAPMPATPAPPPPAPVAPEAAVAAPPVAAAAQAALTQAPPPAIPAPPPPASVAAEAAVAAPPIAAAPPAALASAPAPPPAIPAPHNAASPAATRPPVVLSSAPPAASSPDSVVRVAQAAPVVTPFGSVFTVVPSESQAVAPPADQPPPPAAAPRPRVVPLDLDGQLLGAPRAAAGASTAPAQAAAPPPPRAAAPPAPGASARVIALDVPRPSVVPPLVPLGAADVASEGVVMVPYNKTRPLDLPVDVHDVVVGNPDVVDVFVRTPRQIYLTGKTYGDSNVFLLDRNGQVIRRLDLHVQLDVDTLRATLQSLLPDERIQVSAVGNVVMLSGTARSAEAVNQARAVARRFVSDEGNLVNLLKVSGEQQVLIKVHVAEMNKTVLNELGFTDSFGPGHIGGSMTFGLSTATAGLSTASNAFAATGTLTRGTIANFGPISAQFQALEQRGLVRTLAEPNLTTVSGETANLHAGGQYPVALTTSVNGTLQTTVDYKNIGVVLAFTPVVLDAGRVSLRVRTEVTAVDKSLSAPVGTGTVFGFKTRTANTTVEMPSGGSLMIGGLLQNDISSSVGGTPGLMDVPILGALFRSPSFQRNETELVILVSAYVVQPSDPRQLSVPSDGFMPASELDRYLLGRLQHLYLGSRSTVVPTQALQGPIGYIVE